ncbi:Sterol 14-demethylase [Sesamum angolense]|uniref:sterol 14alpha-demethylase n=1 Tax=Sesamum angolense TaxID=2727404 RepID=A0AAE1WZM8_9LAMI|nr:Sterol 14-demethylase [Sesamum angolense]
MQLLFSFADKVFSGCLFSSTPVERQCLSSELCNSINHLVIRAFGSCFPVAMEVVELTKDNNKIWNVGLLLVATLVAAKLISALIIPRSKKRLPPTVSSLPVVGGLLRFMKGPIVMLREEYPKLGSVFTLNLLNKNITFLIGPEVSAHFFKAPESDLSQQEVYQFNVPTFGPGVVFDVDYSIRQEQFRFFTEALRVTKLKGYVEQMVTETEDYFAKWGDSGEVDLKYELEHVIILTASRCLLGEEVRNKLFDDVSALFHDLDNGMLPISVIFPYLPIPAHRRRDQARKKLADIFANIITSRKQTGKTQNDLLQCFIDSKYKDGRSTTESEVTGLLIAALFAGQHTSSITSTWSGAYLLRNPKFMSAVVDEQKNIMQKHGNKIDYDTLSEMEVLYRCIKEALRLHPPLIMLLRSSHSEFSVKTKEGIEYDIPKGHIVATSPAFANRLPHIYKDPDTYDPDRFAPGRDEDKAAGAFSYISFGGGRHGCLGEPFAYLQIKAIWSHLLRNFEMELVSPFPEIDWNAMVVGVKGKVMVRYKRRELAVN